MQQDSLDNKVDTSPLAHILVFPLPPYTRSQPHSTQRHTHILVLPSTSLTLLLLVKAIPSPEPLAVDHQRDSLDLSIPPT
jgi:hypothetical protein